MSAQHANLSSVDSLRGRTCVITGGAGVIGSVLVRALAGAGVKTAILDLNEKAASELADRAKAETGTVLVGVKADVLDRKSLEAAAGRVSTEVGAVDLLINAAGGNSPAATTKEEFVQPLADLTQGLFGLETAAFARVFDLNFTGTVLPTMVFAADMVRRRQGVILNVSSMNSFRPLTKIPAYSAAKAAVNNFTQWLAVHFAKVNVRVNAVAPGFFLTEQNRFLLTDPKSGDLTARGRKIVSATPMGRFGEPEELAGTVLFLCSDMSKFITGAVIPVDGGFSAYSGV